VNDSSECRSEASETQAEWSADIPAALSAKREEELTRSSPKPDSLDLILNICGGHLSAFSFPERASGESLNGLRFI
jgi:hypothetical protein